MEEQESIHPPRHHIHMNADIFLADIFPHPGIAGLLYPRYDIVNPVFGKRRKVPWGLASKVSWRHSEE